jgi:hypothetical protein
VTIFASPAINDNRIRNVGIYSQDQWTLRRLTLNLGLRFDYINGWDPEQSVAAGSWVPERTYPETRNLPNFKDLSPRVGGAYDLFGNGRTAVKASLGRYVQLEGARLSQAYHPANQQVTSANRTWNDNHFGAGDPRSGNFVPDCNLTAVTTNDECGPLSNARFGLAVPSTQPAADVVTGFGNRTYNWQASASVQHELRPGLSVNFGYFRTWYGNFTVTDNQAWLPSDFDHYCVPLPPDDRIPGAGGQMCGLYDITPAKRSLVDNVVKQSAVFGKQTEVFNGFDLTLQARFRDGALLSGGFSTGHTVTDNCNALPDSPDRNFCRTVNPFAGQSQFKLSGAYPLPWEFQVSATYQDLPGIPVQASYVVSNALIVPTLGRNLAACGAQSPCTANATINQIIEPNTIFEDRIRQFDFRISRAFRVGRVGFDAWLDAFNAFNANTVLAMTTRYGQSWLQPTQILGGRTFKVGARFTL